MKAKIIFTVFCFSFILFCNLFVKEASAATCVVDSLTDTGTGSGASGDLRYCIGQTNASGGADSINSTVVGTILLNSSLPVISDSLTIDGNGGIIVDGQNQSGVVPFKVSSGAVVSINNLTVMRGKGINPNGGCLQVLGSTLNLTNVTVDNCSTTAESGGGIRSESSSLNITNSRIINNHMIVPGSSGSGIFNTGTLTMRGSIVSGNTLPNSGDIGGAGIENFRGTAIIENSTISNNINGNYGAGIDNNGGTLRMSNVTVSNNSGGVQAGGVANIGGTAVLRNCTIAGNSVTRFGGGIYNGANTSSLTIANTIIADNSAEIDGQDVLNFAPLTKLGANIIETAVANSSTISGAGTIINVDPMLLPLNNYGGIVSSQPLNANSPARNAGINSEALDTLNAVLTTDSRGAGFPRIIETTVDLGAFESSVPSSAFNISGRVMASNNRVLRSRARVRLTDLTTGEQRFVSANQFGFYHFSNVPAGANVRIEAIAKNATFAPQTLIIAGEINNLNFTTNR